ncbi:uncharacterized protein LOC143852438 [Tasmannia lanceolata]|uniref:uncharacterized protein LOC143852438 n=1 Tax=Tasmannia lanceolata TaxID=3420 RepID=UPI004063DA6B
MNGISEFMRLAPRYFKDSTSADDAESWLESAEKVFTAMRCNRDEDKVDFVAYMLEGRALHWWKEIKRKYEHHQGPFTWAMFRTEFLTKYFPRSTLYKMQRDFSKLVQGNMTVEEYEVEFDKLVRHVPSMVPDEDTKRDKFEHGLAMYIQKGIAGSNAPETYDELVDRGNKLEAVHAEARELT